MNATWAECLRSWVAEPVLSVLFPPRCVGCGDFESHLCDSCRSTLEHIGADACPRCGEPGPVPLLHDRCARCIDKQQTYAGAQAAFRHHGLARRLVADFKFGGQPVLGRIMSDLAAPAFARYVSSVGPAGRLLVTWVPCHRSAQRERGYNQAEILARRLVASCPAGARPAGPVALVRKTRSTKHQKGLDRAGRQQNLLGAFAIDSGAAKLVPPGVEGLLLVDDVCTTGATAREVSAVLTAGIGLPVYVFTFSRAVASGVERHD